MPEIPEPPKELSERDSTGDEHYTGPEDRSKHGHPSTSFLFDEETIKEINLAVLFGK